MTHFEINLKIKFVIALFIFLTLVSCSPNFPVSQPTGTNNAFSLSPAVSARTSTPTEESTVQSTLTPSLVPTSTPLVIIPPYQPKQVILEYTRFGGALGSPDFVLDGFFGGGRETTVFVLYADGQLILQEWGKPITTKILAEKEQKQLFSLLNKTGFYSVETNQNSDSTNPIYDFGGKYDEVKVSDGVTSCLLANIEISKKVCFYEPYREFLIPEMKELFQFIYDYAPNDLTAYQPDRLLVFVSKGHGFYDSFIAEPSKSSPWLSGLPSLETSKEKFMYIEGENALKVFSLFETRSWLKVFNESGQDYSVLIDVVFPHENLAQP